MAAAVVRSSYRPKNLCHQGALNTVTPGGRMKRDSAKVIHVSMSNEHVLTVHRPLWAAPDIEGNPQLRQHDACFLHVHITSDMAFCHALANVQTFAQAMAVIKS